MKQNVIVLSVSQFMILNDNTGEVENSGCTVRYLLSEDIEPKKETKSGKNLTKGVKPAKCTIPYNDYSKYDVVPGLYEASLGFDVDSKGNTKLKIDDFRFLSEIKINKAKAG